MDGPTHQPPDPNAPAADGTERLARDVDSEEAYEPTLLLAAKGKDAGPQPTIPVGAPAKLKHPKIVGVHDVGVHQGITSSPRSSSTGVPSTNA